MKQKNKTRLARASMMLLAMLCFLGGARADEVTIGSLEDATNNSYIPMCSLYNYSYTQQIYTAEEIGMAGTINSITLWLYGNADLYEMPFDIYMVEVDKDAFSSKTDWVSVTASDIVYSGSVTVHNTDVEAYTFDLTTPFVYSGTGNLLICFNNTTGQWKGGLNGKVFGASGDAVRAIYARQDSGAYDPNNPTFTATGTTHQRNVIELDITPSGGTVCEKPSTFDVSNVTAHEATFSWTSEVGDYRFEYKKSADEEWIDVWTSNNTFTLDNLYPGTAYDARVKTICGEGQESGYKTVNFTTLEVCPDGKVCIGTGTATNSYLPTYTYYNYSLTQQIYTAAELGEAGAILSVDFHSSAAKTRTLDIYMVNTNKNSFESATDWISVTDADKVFSGSVTFAADDWTTIEFDSPFAYDGNSNVVLVVKDNSGSWESAPSFYAFSATSQAILIFSDDTNYDPTNPSSYQGTVLTQKNRVRFAIGEAPTCIKPINLVASEVDKRSATLTWTPGAEEQNTWQICLNGDEEHLIEVATTPSYSFTNLTPKTRYSVKVRAYCSETDQSDWSKEVYFTTLIAAPAPTNLMVSNIGTTSATVSWTSSSNNNQLRYVASPNYVFQGYVTNPGAMADGADASWLQEGQGTYGPRALYGENMIADDFTIYTATSLSEIEVYGYQTGSTTTSTFTGLYAQIYDGNPADGGTAIWGDMDTNIMTGTSFTNCYRGNNGDTNAMTRPIMAITASGLDIELEPGTYWLVYSLEGTGSSGPWGVPNAEPTIGSTGDGLQYASSSWTNLTDGNSGTSYGCAMKLTFEDIETFDWTYVNNIEGEECNLTNLSPDTPYLVQIRSNYGDDGDSQWVSKFFTTLSACEAPIELASTDVTADAATLSWTGYQESYNVRYRTAENSQTSEGSLFEDFESGNLSGWTILREEDGTDYTDWHVVDSENLFSSGPIAAHSGTNVVMGRSWNNDAYSVDNWLITPQVSLNGTLSYWVRDDGEYHEHYDVYVSTTTTDPDAFTLLYEPGDASDTWTQHTVDLTSYDGQQGYIAFRLVDEDQDYLFIDDVLIGTIINTPAGEWITKTATEETLDLTGLTPDTEYEWQVQGINEGCNDGVTDWSGISSFTTLEGAIIKFAAEGYATYFNSAKDVVLPKGMKAQVVTDGSTTLNYSEVANGDGETKVVPAGTAMLLQVEPSRGDQEKTITLTTPTATPYAGTNLLNGSDEDDTYTFGGAPYYKLTYSSSGTNFGWYWGETDGAAFKSPAHKAWLALNKTVTAPFLGLPGWEETTGIVPVGVNPEDGEWYTLQGMKVGKKPTTAGVYIHNGRKIVIK